MSDLISRQAAIDVLKEHRALYCDSTPIHFSRLSYEEKSRVDELDTAIAILVNLPSAQQWIPCSERLPDVRHNVLITDGNHTAEGQLRDNGDWVQYRWTCLRKHEEIIAWMPLPEPYSERRQK